MLPVVSSFQVTDSWLDSDPEDFDPSILPAHVLNAIEADSFWCLSRLLDGIQDNYIFAQPGIQRSVRRMAELVGRIDGISCLFLLSHYSLSLISVYSSSIDASGSPKC